MDPLTLETEAMQSDLYLALGLSGSGKRVTEFPRVLSLLSLFLEKAVQKSERSLDLMENKEGNIIFHGLRIPSLSIQMYAERIFKYSKCSPSCFVLAHIYIDRYLKQPNTHLTSLNVHRLLITSVVVAAKFIDDAYFNNAYYARVGGISTAEMNRLELNFLFSLDFRVSVNVRTFGMYCLQLEREGSGYHVNYQIERPIKIFRRKDWTNDEEKRQTVLQTYSCGAV